MDKLYIATIEIKCTPRNRGGRYLPVKVTKDFQPLILNSDTLLISRNDYDKTINYHLRYKKDGKWKEYVTDKTKYIITYKLTNIKFSSELYGRTG